MDYPLITEVINYAHKLDERITYLEKQMAALMEYGQLEFKDVPAQPATLAVVRKLGRT